MPFHCHACVDMSAGQQATCFSASPYLPVLDTCIEQSAYTRHTSSCACIRDISQYMPATDLEEHAVKFVVHFVCMHSCLYAFQGPMKLPKHDTLTRLPRRHSINPKPTLNSTLNPKSFIDCAVGGKTACRAASALAAACDQGRGEVPASQERTHPEGGNVPPAAPVLQMDPHQKLQGAQQGEDKP